MSVVAGLQTVAQLQATYGREFAQILMSCFSTKLILAAGDNETGRYFEAELGQRETIKESENTGQSSRTADWQKSNNAGTTRSQHIDAAVLASEIQNLPDLHGFLKMPGWPIVRVQLTRTQYDALSDPFIGR